MIIMSDFNSWNDWSGLPAYSPPDVGSWLTHAEEANLNAYSSQYTNQVNAYIAQKNNELNYLMFAEQNDWNLKRRDEEWAYNDPSAQMQRMIDAGINPITAIGQLSNSPAQQLTSADWHGASDVGRAVPFSVSGGSDPIDAILRASSSLVNAMQGGADTFLASRRQALAESMAPSQISKIEADAAESAKRTQLYETLRQFNEDSITDRLKALSKSLDEIQSRINKTDQDTKTGQALESLYKEKTRETEAQAGAIKDYVEQGFKRLAIQQQAVDVQGQSVGVQDKQYQLEKNKWEFFFNHQKVDDTLDFLRIFSTEFGASLEGGAKFGVAGVGGSVSGEVSARGRQADIPKASAAIQHLWDVFIDNPTPENLNAFQRGVDYVQPVITVPLAPPASKGSPVNPQLLNPFVQ